ncbi:hypothetical protein VTJ83DRAFT_1826 [Remersonia thermophila]|uniref:Hybrid signal transduction histidine kinase K n=1 Tax=Remersonia thermophila TaxID=72144 RepID=A0ABR4DJB8_9PEZI
MYPSFVDLSIIDLLEADPRPSFIVALSPHPPAVVYANPSLAADPALLDLITTDGDDAAPLWSWITGASASSAPSAVPAPDPASASSSVVSRARAFLSFSNMYWTRSVVHRHMVVISANEQAPGSRPLRKLLLDAAEPRPSHMATPPKRPASSLSSAADSVRSLGRAISDPGWILPDIASEHRPFLDDIGSVDWAATPLGPMSRWPRKLDETFNQILVDSRPIALYWGPSYITVYNEAFSKLCGAKHPSMLGMPVENTWAEAGQRLRDMMQGMRSPLHRGPVEDEWRFFVERDPNPDDHAGPPRLEETYLKWSLIPIVEGDEVLGFMHPVAETTSVRLWERRMKMLVDLGEALLAARDVDSYWDLAIRKLATVEPSYDIPLAILYAVHDDPDPPPGHGPAKICRLRGALGVPDGHPIAPESIRLRTDAGPLSSSISAALEDQHPARLRVADGTLPASLLHGLRWRGFGDPCHAAVICPIRPTKDENAMGFLLLGLNPRRPYGNDYRQFISLLGQKLATTLASVVLLEEEARRGRTAAEQAAFDQARLEKELAAQTKEAAESMQMFKAVAEVVPVGMCFGDHRDNITYANDAWYEITGLAPGPEPISIKAFLSCVKDEDHDLVCAKYQELKNTRNVQFEFRVKRPLRPATPHPHQPNGAEADASPTYERPRLDLVPHQDRSERHVLATARAEYGPDGSLVRVLTCVTDVTTHKLTAEEAMRRAQQAQNLKRMAEYATVGMYDMDLDGRLLGANKVFFEMCGLPKVDPAVVDIRPWDMCVRKDDHALLYEKLAKMVKEDKVQTVEVRLNTTWAAEDGSGDTVVVPRSVQATMMPVRSSDGTIKSFMGCLSDVSLQRWQLNREKERKEEAIESKRQQENFIDMTSHEMRNPLSAILHCADAITATLSRVQELLGEEGTDAIPAAAGGSAAVDQDWIAEVRELVESGIDNAETIVTCAQHQKRIVDDILTMSKLDSSLISITRVTVDPIKMVKEALKMFEVEARRVDINLSMVVDPCYHELGIKYLDFDPSRLKQVLINLLTNALKFTKTGPTRNVTVAVRASLTRPTEASSKVSFIPPSHRSSDQTHHHHHRSAPANRASPVYLMFEVEDTGEGLTEEEKNSLFQRFVQASSRTHVKYGGSGLGLFISRRLTELQNGSIGVASQPGVGSTFAFYIEAYRPTEEAILEAEALSRAVEESEECAALSSLRLSSNSSGRRGSVKRLSVSCGCGLHGVGGGGSSSSSSSSSIHLSNGNASTNNDPATAAAARLNNGDNMAETNGAINTPFPSANLASASASASASTPSSPTAQLPTRSLMRRAVTSIQMRPVSSSVAAMAAPPIRGVLVVEDNLINQQITRRGLLSMGFTVDVANHGLECLEKLKRTDRFAGMPEKEEGEVGGAVKGGMGGGNLKKGKIGDANKRAAAAGAATSSTPSPPFPLSIILMDIEMPIQDGLTCTRAIRDLERRGVIAGGRIPIIAVSANARLEQIVEARDAGCDDVLVKPYRMPELLDRMRGVMARVASLTACSR